MRSSKPKGVSISTWLSLGLAFWAMSAFWFLWPARPMVGVDVKVSRAISDHTNWEATVAEKLRRAAVAGPPPKEEVATAPIVPAGKQLLADAPPEILTAAEPVAVSRQYWKVRKHPPPPTDAAIVGSTWPPPDPRMLADRRAADPSFPPRQPGTCKTPEVDICPCKLS